MYLTAIEQRLRIESDEISQRRGWPRFADISSKCPTKVETTEPSRRTPIFSVIFEPLAGSLLHRGTRSIPLSRRDFAKLRPQGLEAINDGSPTRTISWREN